MKNVIKFPQKAQPRNELMAHFALHAIDGLTAIIDQAGDKLDINSKDLVGLLCCIHNALETGIIPENEL